MVCSSAVAPFDISRYHNPWSYSTLTGKSVSIVPTPVEEEFSLPWSSGEPYGTALDEKGKKIIYYVMRGGHVVLYLPYLISGQMLEIESSEVVI